MLELDAVVRSVWAELGGTPHGFFALDERTIAGVAIALRRYPWPEVVDVVRWSAHELATGRLSVGYFATTFRGQAFDARHRSWRVAEARRAREVALEQRARDEGAASSASPSSVAAQVLGGDALEQLARNAMLRLRGGGGEQPPERVEASPRRSSARSTAHECAQAAATLVLPFMADLAEAQP
jgi:hypothetical protein